MYGSVIAREAAEVTNVVTWCAEEKEGAFPEEVVGLEDTRLLLWVLFRDVYFSHSLTSEKVDRCWVFGGEMGL